MKQMDWPEDHMETATAFWHIVLCYVPLLAHNLNRNTGRPYLHKNKRIQDLADIPSNSHTASQYHVGSKHTVSIVEPGISAVFFRSMAYGLQAHTLPRTLGGEEHAALLPDLPVISIFHGQQYHVAGMQMCLYPGLLPFGGSPQTGFHRVFKQVGQHGTQAAFRHRELRGQVEGKSDRDALFPVPHGKIAGHTVHGGIFTQAQISLRDAALYFVKICGKFCPIPLSGEALQKMEMVAHIVPRLPCLFNGSPEAVIPRLLHGQELVLPPQTVIAVQAGRHEIKEHIKQQEQKEE